MGRPRKSANQGLPRRVYLKAGSFYYVHPEGQRWENLGRDLVVAKKVAESYGSGASTYGTLGYWLDEWVKFLKIQVSKGLLKPRTLSDYEKALPYLKPTLGALAPRRIEAPHIKEYLDLGVAEDRAIRANREKAALSSCITWMVEHKHAGLTSNVWLLVARNPETPRTRYITDAEYTAVLDLASTPVRAWMECMYRTLQRPADILAWTRFNLIEEGGKRMLSFVQSKTRTPMKIVMGPLLQAAFDEMAEARAKQERKVTSLYLICTRDGQPYTGMGISAMMRRHIAERGIPDFSPYDCKAKGATDLFTSGTPLETISALCGHESVTTTEIYVKRRLVTPVESNERVLDRSSRSAEF